MNGMALRESTRRWAMRGAWAALLIAGSLLVGLRVGRPLYYTDGAREFDGRALATASMLHWDAPEVVAELPGPVAGRVAQLPDGRLLYGRLGADGTSDLVTWDPAHPRSEPEPVYGLNSPANDLAPAVGADGRIWFASDREGGAGGYDLYVAPRLGAAAAEVAPVPACRTALDETDPAPHPNGVDLVFVRSDRRLDGGNDGALFHWRVGDTLDPAPLFAPAARRIDRVIQRDPVFTADGVALWFVQHAIGQRLALQRASLQAGVFDTPLTVGEQWPLAQLRAPLPSADGRELGVLLPKTGEQGSNLWYVAKARLVYPWWPGQRPLEWFLLGVIGASVVLLVLLHLGRRWATLDLVAQCLLLSLLLHVLLYLWLMGVEIVGSLGSHGDDGGGMQVSVVAAGTTASGGGGGGGSSEIADEVRFAPGERSLAAAAPAAGGLRADDAATHDAGAGEWTHDAVARDTAATAALADAAAEAGKRDGVDAAKAIDEAKLGALDASAAARAAAPRNARANVGAEAVEVAVPASGVARAAVPSAALTGATGAEAGGLAAPAAAPLAVGEPTMQDTRDGTADAVAGAMRAGDDAAAPLAIAAGAATTAPGAAAAGAATAAQRGPAPAAPAGDTVAAPGSALARGARVAVPAAAAAADGALAAPRATAAAGPGAAALHEPAAVATGPAAAPRHGTDGAAAAALQPLAVGAPAASAQPAAADARRSAGGVAGEASLAVPRPASSLVRAKGNAPNAAAAGGAAAAIASRSGATSPTPVATATRDAPGTTSAAERAKGGAAAGTPAPLVALDVGVAAPGRSSIARVERAGATGTLPPAGFAIAPPGTQLARGRADAAATAPEAMPLAQPTAYSNRFGPAKVKALEQFGGTDATERAVANGLRYLAKLQLADGTWGDHSDFDAKYGFVYVGKTALCVLAFLGAGHTPQSHTEHSEVVKKALAHLLSLQDDDGAFGPSSCYSHGITTYALAECFGITKDQALRRPLERALTWILDHQGPRRDRRNRGGWGYFSPGLQAEDDYARVSVSSWMIMALESARLSGIELPPQVLPAAREFLTLAYDQPNGWFRYNHKPSRVNSAWPTLPASTPAGAFCLLLLGAEKDDPMVRTAVDYTVERRPQEYRRYADDDFVLRGQGNVYFWYYGTLACFLAGGDAWAQWNERLRTVLPLAQGKDGSWAPIDVYAEEAGDNRRDHAYTTAMCVLCLEVYYRYFTPLLLGR
ncbi:MAG: prenyltransferase/squalene oxidase repeat-containing protein [Pirellulales bacterium]